MGVQINGSEGNVIATKGTYSGNVTIGGTLTYEDVTNIDSVGIITARSGIEIGASPGVGASISVDGNAIFSGITTAETLKATTGIVTTLTATTGIVTSFVTNTAKVGAAVTISESGIEASGIGITCASINGTQIGGRRNLVINGAMEIAQRGTSSTTAGMYTVDRFTYAWGGHDEAPTQAQVDVSSGTTPYTEGFRKAYKVTNGNQTSGAGASDLLYFEHHMEAQDIANSGWNYTSSSSFITLSFWVKSSVSQDFKGYVRTPDGSSHTYAYSTGTLSANTWTKVTKTIPGNSNLTIDNNTQQGFQIYLWPYIGTTYTDAGVTEDAWTSYVSSARTPVSATSWWTTNDATFEITGVQLEVGSQATTFEHRSFGEELALCQRYYYRMQNGSSSAYWVGHVTSYGSSTNIMMIYLPVCMRDNPTLETSTTASHFSLWGSGTVENLSSVPTLRGSNAINPQVIPIDISHSITAGDSRILRAGSESYIAFNSEL